MPEQNLKIGEQHFCYIHDFIHSTAIPTRYDYSLVSEVDVFPESKVVPHIVEFPLHDKL